MQDINNRGSGGGTYEYKLQYLVNATDSYAVQYECHYQSFSTATGEWVGHGGRRIFREGDSCAEGQLLNADAHYCFDTSVSVEAKQRGKSQGVQACAVAGNNPESAAGLLINAAIGNIYQAETDYSGTGVSPVSFVRHYNSNNGLWNHTYSTHLVFDSSSATLVDATGKQITFVIGNGVVAEPDQLGSLKKTGVNWIYTSLANDTQTFNVEGKLIGTKSASGVTQTLTYGAPANVTTVTVNDSLGNSLWFTQDGNYRPAEMHTAGLDITYGYNGSGQFYRADRSRNGQIESRTYLYEVAGKPNVLTGIVDERGIRIATWAYDDQGRTVSSEQAGGTGKVEISYNADGSSTVTNELGKKTVYRYQVIHGVKHIVEIEGEPSANCPASNSTFTYNDRGQVLTQTDAKGFVTTYTYNDRGLETTRTEASGTPQARTKTTTWHATFNLPLTVTEGGQVTTYTYDSQGRQTSRTQTAL